jgi:Fur family ferric uptake transcriptional regulator
METIKTILHTHGIKNTPKKHTILQHLQDLTHPVDTNTLFTTLREEIALDKVTIYRTLQQFKEKGIVREIVGSDGVANYEFSEKQVDEHGHFECENCKTITCLAPLHTQSLLPESLTQGMQVHSVNIVVHGICQNCLKETAHA